MPNSELPVRAAAEVPQPQFDAALGDRHRRRHDIDAAQQLVELVGRRVVAVGELFEPQPLDRRQTGRRAELAAQEDELLALGQHALIDLEDHRQERGDEQQLARRAFLGDEVGRHALDLDRGHRLALADVGQRIGGFAKEAGQLVSRARIDRAQLNLAAHRVAGGGEAAMAAACLTHAELVGLDVVANEGEAGRLRGQLEEHVLRRSRDLRPGVEGEERGGVDRRQRLPPAHSGREDRRPHRGKSKDASAIA